MGLLYRNVLFRTKYYFKQFLKLVEEKRSRSYLDIDYDNSVLFMLAGDYNNIGDLLIKEAQTEFIEKELPDKKIVAVDYGDTFKFLKSIKKRITENTIVVLTGGGNTDDRATGIEIARNQIIKQLKPKKCKIISFPQTVDYSASNRGKFYLNKTKKAFASNERFVFFARERVSFGLAKKYFGMKNTRLAPDIVMTLEKNTDSYDRDGVGFLIRNDIEKKISNDFMNSLVDILSRSYKVTKNDMTVSGFDKNKTKNYIEEKVDFVSHKKVIITDRLHGMILCYITNTPCVVFCNNNHKILETYNNWLKNSQNFIILENESEIDKIASDIYRLANMKEAKKDNLNAEYITLREELTNK